MFKDLTIYENDQNILQLNLNVNHDKISKCACTLYCDTCM